MSKAVILQHVAHEGPGRIVPVFRDFGIQTDVRRLFKGDEVPTDLDEITVLVVLGGPMGVGDIGDPKYPFLEKEVETLRRLVQADRPVLGICLGAQLLAHASGAKVSRSETPELGWGPVTFPFPGGTEPIVMGMIDSSPMFHWHLDTFELPKLPVPANPPPGPPAPTGNALLSSSKACKNQAFRFKTRLFGFQYHVELDRPGIDAIVAGNREQLTQIHGADAEQALRADTEKHYPRYERLGNRLLGNFVQFLKVHQ